MTAPAAAVPGHSARLPLLDAVKGLACAVIVGHHFALYGPMAQGGFPAAAGLIQWLAHDGRLAVQVFLVLAGYFAAYTLAPGGEPRVDRPVVRVLQRYGRLVMPYLVALSLSVLIAAAVRSTLDDDLVPAAPGFGQLLAHAFLLQDLLGYEALSAGVWYVAIDFQLFTLAVAAIGLSRMLKVGRSPQKQSGTLAVVLVAALAIASLAVFNRHAKLDSTGLYFFGSYGLGMLVFWIGRAARRSTWLIGIASIGLVGASVLALDWRSRIATALVTALSVAIAQRHAGGPGTWPAFANPLVRLGRLSYSLFLIHFPVLLMVSAGAGALAPLGRWAPLTGLLMTFMLSIGAAVLLHRWVETRPASWRAVLALLAGFLICGAIVSG